MTKIEWLDAQGPWLLDDDHIIEEFWRLKHYAYQLADDADEAERRLRELRKRGQEFLEEFAS